MTFPPSRDCVSLPPRLMLGALALAAATAIAHAEPPAPPSGAEIQQELKSFATMGSVLMIAAHPDDENTQLITYLARGRGYRMGYLSVTRGDGGQNVLGGEFGPELGYIRTNELLAARNLDHGVQFFTRAIDFGYSKTPVETLKIWDQQQVLQDVVRVIRNFRPDVIVTRFAPDQTNTHGHHTASAILGLAAFKIAGDARVLPDVPVWQPKRIFVNAGGGGGRGGTGAVRISVGGTDPVLNESYGQIATESRAMHKSQGFGNLGAGGAGRGPGGGGGGNPMESFNLLDGTPAANDIMDGIDTTWARAGKGGDEIAKLAADAIAKFDPKDPGANVPALLEIKRRAAALAPDPVVDERLRLLDRIIADCIGLTVETTIPNADVVAGEAIKLHHSVTLRSDIHVTWMSVRYPVTKAAVKPGGDAIVLMQVPQTATRDSTQALPAATPVSQPYWLRKEPDPGIFHVDDPALIGRPVNLPVFPVEYVFRVGGGDVPDAGQEIVLPDEPVQLFPNASPAQQRRPLAVVAPVSLAFASEVHLLSGDNPRPVAVEVTAHRANVSGTVKIDAPADWFAEPESQNFTLPAVGDHKTFSFTLRHTLTKAGTGTLALSGSPGEVVRLGASATIGDQTYNSGWKEIAYEHLPRLLLQPPASTTLVAMNLNIRGKTIGYIPGAGDSVADCIEQMGYTVKELKPADLTTDGIKGLDAIVLGVRAFNVRNDLAANSPALKAIFDYADAGGTVVEQYNRPDGPGGVSPPGGRGATIAPFSLHISGLRVTDETAKVTFLAPDHPVLNTPNRITNADFAGWVQERNIYLPDQADAKFTQILGMADPGETPPNTSLLVAPVGKGYFVYTSLVFFRELPAGNPGAYRLFANLLSLGKP